MAKFRIDSLGELARQMGFTPHHTRLAQLNAAEELLHSVEPQKAYPLEFVIYRITGYRPRSLHENLLTGLALQHDLGLLIERVSETLDVTSDTAREPVLSIDDVTERFNVTSKTIQRWRRKGLPARRFIFPDGKRRVGFLIGSVERFFAAHRDQVPLGTNLSQVDEPERLEILRRARRLAAHGVCCADEIARRIARRLNRSPVTVLHTIRRHDRQHPHDAILRHDPRPLDEEDRQRIVRGFRRGRSLKSLARKTGHTWATIYRVIMGERIERLNRRKTRFIDDPLYHQSDAAAAVEEIAAQQVVAEPLRPEDNRIPRDLPTYLQDLYRVPLLSAAQERALFLKFNFHKFQFVSARRKLEPQFAAARDLDVLEGYLRQATATKNQIVRANLRLVVSVARKHLRPGLSLMELISDGNLTLMRAVDSFDAHRGHRFSTYATFALMKGFARSVPQMLAGQRATGVDEHTLATVPDPRQAATGERFAARDQLRQLLSRLSDRERNILLAHYGLGEESATYEQVGQRLGLSKQRVRQVEKLALAKLRRAAESIES